VVVVELKYLPVRIAPVLLVVVLGACAPWQPAPVEDRRSVESAPSARPSTQTPTQRLPAPPFYEVSRGDTLYSIAFRYGLDWRSVAAWNRIEAPFTIRPGQELRLTPPVATAASRPAETPRPAEPVTSRPAPRPASTPAPTPAPAPAPETRPAPAEPARTESRAPAPAAATGSAPSRNVAGVSWRWPTEGRVIRPFDPSATRRGIGVSGQVGQPVVAAAAGEVVYSGTALIGYGELIIIKHSDSMLSAYAHNRRRLVSEGQRVEAGQAIAEMGMNERDEVLLHFEIRRNGQAEDPLRFLPQR
jgi:lipoprotein NlpD